MPEVYVVGHKNPEADAICSAIAYANLKNITSADTHIPARLGRITADVSFILKRFGVAEPVLIPHVRVRVRDVMTTGLITASPESPLRVIGELVSSKNIRSIPIVDDGKLVGLVSERDLAQRYLQELKIQSFVENPASLAQIAETLRAKILLGEPEGQISGQVFIGAMRPETMAGYLGPGDVVLIGDRAEAQERALQSDIGCLIVTGGLEPAQAQLELAAEKDSAVLVTPYDTYAAARLINLSVPASHVMNTDFATAGPDELFSDIVEDVLNSANREVLAVDEENRPLGIITRTNLVRPPRRRVILVDHNERGQAADGIDEAEVLEIIDHHRIGDVQTADPILVINEPLGATCTIVARRYRELGVEISREMAGTMLAAILSDTVMLKSPTTTDIDREVVAELAAICEEDWESLGHQIFAERQTTTAVSAAELLGQDMKTYHFGESKVAVAQVETVNSAELLGRKTELLEAMSKFGSDREYETVALMVTDIVRESTELLVAGKTRVIERAFDAKVVDGSVTLPGVISRKKQVASRLVEASRV